MNPPSEISKEATVSPPAKKETTVGDYFVSNYPPFSFWKPEFVLDIFAAIDVRRSAFYPYCHES